jgi:hypothetical protein
MSSWVDDVACQCLTNDPQWSVIRGVWTCSCGREMSPGAIAAMHKVKDGTHLSAETLKMLAAEVQR